MEIVIKEMTDRGLKESAAREILYDLPEWFGMPESTETYIRESKGLPFIVAYADGKLAGFIVLQASSHSTAEIFVMGVKKEFHGMGVGRRLNAAYEDLAKKSGYTYSQVKTVQSGHYKEYDITNHFYQAMAYVELECFPDMWDKHNPCQIYVKYLGELDS